MLHSVVDRLNNAKNPFSRVKRCFPRYVLITACTGIVGFGIAWALLHAGVGPLLTLIASALVSGTINYLVMELWAFPHRQGRLSWKRLAGNAMVGAGGFAARYGVLVAGLKYFAQLPGPVNSLLPLTLAYLASFIIGFSLRRLIVFRR